MPCHAPSGKQILWHSAVGRTVPWRSASELSRLHLKRPERLVHPDAKDAIFFFLMNPVSHKGAIVFSENGRLPLLNPFILMRMFGVQGGCAENSLPTTEAPRGQVPRYFKPKAVTALPREFSEYEEVHANLMHCSTSSVLRKLSQRPCITSINRLPIRSVKSS